MTKTAYNDVITHFLFVWIVIELMNKTVYRRPWCLYGM